MVNLTEILQKELRDGDESKGYVQKLLFDNLARGCLLKTDCGIFVVDKIVPRWDFIAANTRSWQNEPLTKQTDKKSFIREMAIGQQIIDQNGTDLGELADAEMTNKLAVKRLLLSSGKYLSRGEISAVGDVIITKAKSAKRTYIEELRREKTLEKLNASRTEAKLEATAQSKNVPNDDGAENCGGKDLTQTNSGASVKADGITASKANLSATETIDVVRYNKNNGSDAGARERTATTVNGTIRRKYGDFSFLIGKSVDKTVVNFQGEVMIKQHETITRDVLRQAKISGKLLELYLHIE
ncbi:MAG: hypothetical protein NC132_02385 [Corallococcus sp.]|nr:hypothetical protein [Corallococcus sp.]MCM1358957.1 hypothetical protein [Corallococcus sp.]MCM1394946.1 hypothetical protein [Corallococcus sp.]